MTKIHIVYIGFDETYVFHVHAVCYNEYLFPELVLFLYVVATTTSAYCCFTQGNRTI